MTAVFARLRDAARERYRSLPAEERERLLNALQARVLRRPALADVRAAVREEAERLLAQERPDLASAVEVFATDAYERLFSLGPLEKHLQDPEVTDITVIGTRVTVVRAGRREEDPDGFVSEAEVRRVFDRIAARAGKALSYAEPSLDAELPDGSRAVLVIPPKSEKPYACIRRHLQRAATLDELIPTVRGLDGVADFLRECVRARRNVLLAGSTGAGKTTLLNALLKDVQPLHLVAVLEDTREVALDLPYVLYFKTREDPPITWADIIKDCLRFFPQRIVLAEVRTPDAAYNFVQALNTGHAGSMTTVHANSALDALYRVETLVQEHSGLGVEVVRRLVARVVNVVVFLRLVEDERGAVVGRELAEVVEVLPELEDGRYVLKEVAAR